MHLFAGFAVTDYQRALPWYERLLGSAPSFLPHETEAVWELGEGRAVYIVQDAERAGHAIATAFVDDLDARLGAIAARGLEPAGEETYANGVRKVTFRDADGNEISFAGGPAG